MRRHAITDEQWGRIENLLPGRVGSRGMTARDNRSFVDAVLWIAKTGIPWRDLPERFGKWNTVWRRFHRWAAAGVWQTVFEALREPDLEWLILDSTVVQAHQNAAGKKGGPKGPPSVDREEDSAPRSTSRSTLWEIRSASS